MSYLGGKGAISNINYYFYYLIEKGNLCFSHFYLNMVPMALYKVILPYFNKQIDNMFMVVIWLF